jgi:hypothetical protein
MWIDRTHLVDSLAGCQVHPLYAGRECHEHFRSSGLKKFRSTAWKCQQTFLTPMNGLRSFVVALVAANEQTKSGCVTIEQVVFEPTNLLSLLASYSMPPRYARGISLVATRQEEVETLLHAIFRGWIDFIFVPEPRSFAIYADHDEYTTFFSQTRSDLNRVVKTLVDKGFKVVPHYERRL